MATSSHLDAGRNLVVKQQQQAAGLSQVADSMGGMHIFTGQFQVNGIGEATKEVVFPVVFSQVPLFFIGGFLDDNQSSVATSLPTFTGGVVEYRFDLSKGQQRQYKGALICAVITGISDQVSWVNYMFVGDAVVQPTNATATTDHSV
mgnify:CR=1 FL=1